MDIYRIKTEDFIYVKAVIFDTSSGELVLQMIPTIDPSEAGWYEEDKAKRYCEELNKNAEMKEANIKFKLELVHKNNEA